MTKITRETSSKRSLKFIERNSLDNERCLNYVINLLDKYFKINKYNFSYYDNYKSLLLTYQAKSYLIFFSKEEVCLQLLKLVDINKNKYSVIKKFKNDSCWTDCFNYIIEKGV